MNSAGLRESPLLVECQAALCEVTKDTVHVDRLHRVPGVANLSAATSLFVTI